MTLQQLVYFRKVATVHHFTHAAEDLFVSQSSLSYSIQQLEKELGVPLFLRQKGKEIKLTVYGEVLLASADRIVDEIEGAKKKISQLRDSVTGKVNIAYSYTNGYSLVPKVLKAFRDDPRNKGIELHVEINHGKRYFEHEIENEKIDIAFSAGAKFEGVESIPIARQELFVFVPIDKLLTDKLFISLEDLQDESIMIYLQGRHLHRWIEHMHECSGLELKKATFFEDWSEMMDRLTLGEGVVISPRFPVDTDAVRVVPLHHPMNMRTIYMHYKAGTKLSKSVEIFRDFCINYFLKNSTEEK